MPHAIAAPSPRLLVLRERAAWLSDLFAAGVAAALPWSTSATSILIGLWLVSVIPALNWETVRRAITTPAGATPVLLWFLALIGMLWADVSWHDRLHGLDGFHK